MARDALVWDLAVTLRDLLRGRVMLPDGHDVNFTVEPPRGMAAESARPLVYVCLYELEENVPARRMEKTLVATVEENGDLCEYYQMPALPLHLRFLLACDGRSPEEEYRLLGQFLRVIYDHPVLQGAELVRGESVGPDEKIHVSVRSAWGIEAQSRFWQAMGATFRPAVCCQLSVFLESERRERVVRVKERVVEVRRSVTSS